MKSIDEARNKINEIDAKMIALFKERMEAVKTILQYKIENKLPIYDEARELELIERNIKELNSPELERCYKIFFNGVLRSSKAYQWMHMNQYGLIGEKLSHSYSSVIHEYVYQKNNVDACYNLLEIKEEQIKETLDLVRNGFYRGLNVTIPYKEKVIPFVDELTPEAKAIGAVNTIYMHEGKLIGANTDYYGFLMLLKEYHIDTLNKNVFILGTGGASKAIKNVLEDNKAKVTLVSRTKGYTYSDLEKEKSIDILINATPVGMYPNIDACPVNEFIIKKASKVIDIIYNPERTKLLELANSNNGGLIMLIHQALFAEELWNHCDFDYDINEIVDLLKGGLQK